MIEIKNYDDMSHMTLDNVIEFMSKQSREDIRDFKRYCSTTTTVKYKDGSEKDRTPVFFEIRRWVVDKYFPDALKMTKAGGKAAPSMLDRIMAIDEEN